MGKLKSKMTWTLFFVFLVVSICVFDIVEARGGGGRGGGGRGGSRGGRRGGRGRSISSKTRSAIRRYKGPKYTSADWKSGMARHTVWGIAFYKSRAIYKQNRDKEPIVCFNAVTPKNGTYAYFVCPEAGQPDNWGHCCGEEGDQKCCEQSYSIVWTVIIIVACVLIVIGSLIYNAVKLLV